MEIAVLGAGLAGVSAAFYLSKQGHSVTLFERESAPCLKTSFANGGQLSYDYVDPLASPAMLKKIPKMLLGMDSAFKLGRGNSVEFVDWGMRFLARCTKKSERETIKNMMKLAQSSRHEIHQILTEYDLSFNYNPSGKLHIYHKESEFSVVQKKVLYKQSLGSSQKILTVTECLAQEPVLSASQQEIVGGTFSPDDELGDAYLFSQELLKIAVSEYGLKVENNTAIKKLVSNKNKITKVLSNKGSIEADHFVVALGSYSPLLLKPLGARLPIYPMKGYSVTLQSTKRAPKASITDAKHKLVFSNFGDRFRVAGFAHFMGYDRTIDPEAIKKMLSVCQTIFPEAADYNTILGTWTGLRPMTPNSEPLIGKASPEFDNLWLNTGHGMLGWTLMMGSGKKLAELIR